MSWGGRTGREVRRGLGPREYTMSPLCLVKDAAELAGVGLATWVRERVRGIARRELEEADKPVAFLLSSEKVS
jgi:hypothetical protein